MQLNLPSNRLYGNQQLIEFEKITALIGENGAGKSSILQSIFVNRLAKSILSDKKVVCFSSGQNEKFSEHFSNYLNQERNAKEGANKRGNSSRLTQSFHFFMFEPIFSPVNALNQPI